MRRALVLLLVILAALVAAGPTAGASGPKRGMYLEFHSDGFYVQVKSELGSGRMRLFLYRHGEVAYYFVPARIGAGTVKARFGHLGSIDLKFTPGRRKDAHGCGGGEGEGWQRGIFRGTFVFHGEHDYANIKRDRDHGYFQTHPVGDCVGSGRSDGARPATASRATHVAETGVLLEGVAGSRQANRFFYFFTENRPAGVQVLFNAFLDEQREGMLIQRGVQNYGGAAAFDWNLGAETASAEPPAPFTGRAFFRRGADGRSSWRGSLRAPILGGKPMRLTGAAFDTHLGPAS
jgi:hypothetical protein